MHVALLVNTEDSADLPRAIALLEFIANTGGSASVQPVDGDDAPATVQGREEDGAPAPQPGPDLAEIVKGVADPDRYGPNRLGFLRLAAAAGDEGLDIEETKDGHFKGSHQGYGGTHSSIEKNWRGRGGEVYAAELIAESEGRHVMYGPARKLMLDLLGEP